MLSMKTWMLGAALVASGFGMASTHAKAAQFGIYVGAPAAYVPPCPGPGYEWVAGYYADGYWVPGRWAYAGGPVISFGYRGGYDRDAYRDHRDWDRDHDRRDWDRDRDRRDGDHDRGRDHDSRGHEGFRR